MANITFRVKTNKNTLSQIMPILIHQTNTPHLVIPVLVVSEVYFF